VTARWVWARKDNRWDVYPQDEPLERLRVEPDGPHFVRMFYENGGKVRVGYQIVREAEAPVVAS